MLAGEAVNTSGTNSASRWRPCSTGNMKGPLLSLRGIERALASSDPIGEPMRLGRFRVRPTPLVLLALDRRPQSTNTPVVMAATIPSTARAASCL